MKKEDLTDKQINDEIKAWGDKFSLYGMAILMAIGFVAWLWYVLEIK